MRSPSAIAEEITFKNTRQDVVGLLIEASEVRDGNSVNIAYIYT
jgi:hypothetical protein